MKFQTSYIYHFVTAIIFFIMAVYLFVVPDAFSGIPSAYRTTLIVVLVLWALFRGMNGYYSYQRSKRDKNEG